MAKDDYDVYRQREWLTLRNATQGITPNLDVKSYDFLNRQATFSMNNGGAPGRGSKGDVGGPFKTTLYEYRDSTPVIRATAGSEASGVRTFVGPQYAYSANGGLSRYAVLNPSTSDELDALGTTAIAQTIPTNPAGSLVTTIGELRSEGIPKLLGAQSRHVAFHGRRRDVPEALSGDYLNYQFGWKPLLSELHAFAHTVKNSEKILNQYRKGSDQKIKRFFSFPTERSTETVVLSDAAYPTPVLDTYLYGPADDRYVRGPLSKTTTTQVRRWFEGAFRYHVPVGNDVLSEMRRYSMEADRLFGVAPTPEVVWNLTPWSWAFDWVGNTGDIMTNVSAFLVDGLVLQYGYMMEEKKTSVTYSLTPRGGCYSAAFGSTGTTGRKAGMSAMACSQTWTTTVKSRVRATPYGFGFNWDGFSPTQLGILAALGITRGAPKFS